MIIEFVLVALAIFLLTVILEKLIIPILKSHKVGQKILEIGPRWHVNKAETFRPGRSERYSPSRRYR